MPPARFFIDEHTVSPLVSEVTPVVSEIPSVVSHEVRAFSICTLEISGTNAVGNVVQNRRLSARAAVIVPFSWVVVPLALASAVVVVAAVPVGDTRLEHEAFFGIVSPATYAVVRFGEARVGLAPLEGAFG